MTDDPKRVLDRQYLEMRWRCLSLAADFDRVDRAANGSPVDDPRLERLKRAVAILLEPAGHRAEKVQMLLSDRTPPPVSEGKS